ncbi:hypothetical protein [Hydrogenophaga sp. MI9]|uniref:hypothetical protein n=1 Tax=Hydrogenophaga sp. MI9 TaxID=3453719 RepID=UPI003EEAD757
MKPQSKTPSRAGRFGIWWPGTPPQDRPEIKKQAPRKNIKNAVTAGVTARKIDKKNVLEPPTKYPKEQVSEQTSKTHITCQVLALNNTFNSFMLTFDWEVAGSNLPQLMPTG